ncbi:C2 domain-containing protein [Flagelloscypha sp. PMI_526]|nr:C2 domain-containing protein [Flagelloscypha sp. PMI_526]
MSTNGLSGGSLTSNGHGLATSGAEEGHSFDPNASPAEKAAAAGKARSALQPVNGVSLKPSAAPAREVQLDTQSSNVIPTINIQHAGEFDTSSSSENKVQATEKLSPVSPASDDMPPSPGSLRDTPAPLPDLSKVGWRNVSGIDTSSEEQQAETAVIDAFLSDQFYGSWYHNAGIIVFAVLSTHFLTRFNFGFGWVFIILAFCATYYKTSIQRVRRNARDDIQRELVKTRLLNEHESAEWMNNFLDRFWLIYEPVLSATIVSSVDWYLSAYTPAFLDSLRLSHFTLGNKAPRIDKVRTHPQTEDDIVTMDWGISFTPNDTSDLTETQKKSRTNPKVILSIRVGKGMVSGAMPVVVEDISFSGLMRVRLKLMTAFPHIQLVELSFLDKPVIDYVLKPVGGESLGLDIASIPGLSSFIRDTTHDLLGPMMYDPNIFTLNLEQIMSGKPLDTAIGVLQVTIESARGIKGVKLGGGTPDPFVSLAISDRAELAKTKYKLNTYNPTWAETKFLLINNLSESLTLNLYDYNDKLKNQLLGSTSFDLSKLHEDSSQEGIVSQLLKDGKDRGELRYDVSFYPVLTPEEGGDEAPDSNIGIVRLVIHQAKNLDASHSMSGDLNPFARVYLNNDAHPIHSTQKMKRTAMPVWESPHEFLCSSKQNTTITIKVIDDRDFLKDPKIGFLKARLTDLLDEKKEGRDWYNLASTKSGKIRISAEWKPLNMAGNLHGTDTYTPPIGVVRLAIDRATDVKNVEATLGGKSDPYVRVQVNNMTKGRTEVINNNLNPVWDAIIYVPVHSLKEVLLLECMDYQHLTKDRSLGSVDLRVSELAAESDDPKYPFKSIGVKDVEDPIRLDGGKEFKGKLHYRATFIPALSLKGVKFDAEENELQKVEHGESDSEGGYVDSISSVSEDEDMTNEVTFKKGHRKGAKSTDTTKTVNTVATQSTNISARAPTPPDGPTAEDAKVSMTTDELLQQQSGILVFSVVSGVLAKKGRIEVLLDDGYWPVFSTTKSRSVHAQWQMVGEGFLKELDFGQVWLRLNEADEGEKDDIEAEWKGEAKAFLRDTLNGPKTFTLHHTDDPTKNITTVTIESRYVPVPVTLEPRESINNQGTLRVDVISAHDLIAADRGGKSDPFAVFSLDDKKVFKSQTIKKTLNPEWNESFTTSVPSRVGSNFEVEVYDWDQVGSSDLLGAAKIDLASLESFEASEQTLKLVHPKHGQKGTISIRMMFQPEIIVRSRKNTSTFSTAGRALTTVGGLPVTGAKGIAHGIHGIFSSSSKDSVPDVPHVPSSLPSGQASHPIGDKHGLHATIPSTDSDGTGPNIGPGTLKVTVIQGKDLLGGDAKPYATLRIGDKEVKTKHIGKTNAPEWNESFTFSTSSVTTKMFVWVHDHKTIGKDKLIGDGEVDIWRHIQPNGVTNAEVLLELRDGNGLVKFNLEFSLDTLSRDSPEGKGSISSIGENKLNRAVSGSQASLKASRFSFSRRRHPIEDEDN